MQIILVPGLASDGWMWRDQLGALSRIAPVLIARNDGLPTLGAMAARILEGTAGPVAFVGHSMGGRVSVEAALMAPDRVVKLAILDSGTAGPGAAEASDRRALAALAAAEGMGAVADTWLPPMLGDAARASRMFIDGFRAMMERCTPADFALQQEALLSRPDRSGALATIAADALLVAGSEDRWSTPDSHRAMAETMPHATFVEIAGAGHMTPVEQPDAVTAALARFLAA